jgi:bifunctional non-homologous end joining protein LigD
MLAFARANETARDVQKPPTPFEQGEIGPELFRHACLMGLEGLVSKHRESPYHGGRFDRWVKVKNRQHPAFSRVMDQF